VQAEIRVDARDDQAGDNRRSQKLKDRPIHVALLSRSLFQLIQKIKDEKVKVIVMEPYFDHKTPQSVAERTGAKLIVLYPSVGGAKSGTDDYFQLFDTNIANLIEALQ